MYKPETKTILVCTDPETETEYSFVLDLTKDDGATIIIGDLTTHTSRARYYEDIPEAYSDWEQIMKSIVFGYGTPESHIKFLKRDRSQY